MTELTTTQVDASAIASSDVPQVWILEQGEDYEGGHIVGVYLDRALAVGDFLDQARDIDDRFGIDAAETGEASDGSFYAHGGCDWLQLRPHEVVTRRQLH
ncbi:hypothetical protein ACFCY8_11200 [Streptomyces noursei]|uniref:hypothetical protein n=1 Tax=Streptomyces noursei TaxID=1971 RepID=UPI0035E05D2C